MCEGRLKVPACRTARCAVRVVVAAADAVQDDVLLSRRLAPVFEGRYARQHLGHGVGQAYVL